MKKFEDPFGLFFAELRRDYQKNPVEIIGGAVGIALGLVLIWFLSHAFS